MLEDLLKELHAGSLIVTDQSTYLVIEISADRYYLVDTLKCDIVGVRGDLSELIEQT